MTDVTYKRDEYVRLIPDWQMVRDVVAGERKVKDRSTVYLPQPNPQDKSKENQDRYKDYLQRAVFYGATGRTLAGLIGVAYARWPEVKLPESLDYMREDADGSGLGVVGLSQQALDNLLQTGRGGFLADYPSLERPVSRAEQQTGDFLPSITMYRAEDILNWRTTRIGGKNVLTLVVVREREEKTIGYGLTVQYRYRELALDRLTTEDDTAPIRYVVRIWGSGEDSGAILIDEFEPRDGAGNAWDRIPFTFIGATNNDPMPDRPPMLDLASLNLAHYRNSADYEDSVYMTGQPQAYVAGLDEAWRDHLQAQGIYLGSRSVMPLPVGGSFGIVQAQPNTLAREAMQDKLNQMISLGARLMQPGEAVKTAQQARDETRATYSVLSLACDNVSQAMTRALRWAARFLSADEDECSFSIGTDFTGLQVDAQLLTALVQAWQAGAIPDADTWSAMRALGLIDPEKDDEAVRTELANSGAGLGLED